MTTGLLSSFLPVNGLVLIQSQTASSSATINFATGINSTYNEFRLVGLGLKPATDDVELWLRVSQDAGSNYITANYNWRLKASDGETNHNRTGSADAKIVLAGGSSSTTACGNDTGENVSFVARIIRPAASSLSKLIAVESCFLDATGALMNQAGVGLYTGNTNAIDGLRVMFESGNIASGVLNLYGVKG